MPTLDMLSANIFAHDTGLRGAQNFSVDYGDHDGWNAHDLWPVGTAKTIASPLFSPLLAQLPREAK